MNTCLYWVLSDGKAGDELQCLGVVQTLGNYVIKRIKPRQPWKLFMPFGPIDPGEASGKPLSPIRPPFPDCVIASGRCSVPYLRYLKKQSGGRIFTVYLKDPRTGAQSADLIWAPSHDKIDGSNVIKTLTPPHRISQERLKEARLNPDQRLSPEKKRKVAVLVGGNSRHHHFSDDNIRHFITDLEKLAQQDCYLMITVSRRTPQALLTALQNLAERYPDIFLWDGTGDNPYISLLALAEWVIVTTDSYNLVGEAAASGAPLLLFRPDGGHLKFDEDIRALKNLGIAHDFSGELTGASYEPVDSTPLIANRIQTALQLHKARL